MKSHTIVIFLLAFILYGCQFYERIYLSDIDAVVSSNLAENDKILKGMLRAMKDMKVDTLRRNINFYARLKTLQQNTIAFCDSLSDFTDHAYAIEKTNAFLDRNIRKKNFSEPELPFSIDGTTPIYLLKLHVSLSVHNFLLKKKDQYDMPRLAWFTEPEPLIIFDKPMFLRSDTVTGRVLLASVAAIDSTARCEMFVNGKKISVIKGEGKFKLKPDWKNGAKKFILKAKVTFQDSLYVVEDSVYLQK